MHILCTKFNSTSYSCKSLKIVNSSTFFLYSHPFNIVIKSKQRYKGSYYNKPIAIEK